MYNNTMHTPTAPSRHRHKRMDRKIPAMMPYAKTIRRRHAGELNVWVSPWLMPHPGVLAWRRKR